MEHLHHFGLSQDPFSNEPDLRFFFESGFHRDAQRRVERGLRQHKGLTLLTGEGGMGKTLLARRVLEALEEEVFEATLLVMLPGAADATGILQRFARQIGCEAPADDRATLLGQIYEQLAIVREDGRHAVLIIDDAQVMTPAVFAELAGLLNLEYEDRRLVSMLFVGSPELDAIVQNDASVLPRVDVRVRLQPLDFDNASAYLTHRLATVGGRPEILPDAAVESLFKFGRGRPRLMNTLADNALFEAYLGGRPAMEPGDVERAAADLGIGPDPGSTWSPLAADPVASTPMAAPVVAASAPAATVEAPSMEKVSVAAAAPPVMSTAFDDVLASEGPGAGHAPAPVLDLDEPLDDFALAPEPPVSAPTLDLDAGLEEALGDFDAPPAATPSPAASRPAAEPDLEPLEFDVEPPAAPRPEPEASVAPPVRAAMAPAVPDADVAEAPLLVAEPIEAGDDEDLLLADAELAPLEIGEADQLEDAFVELLDE